MSDIKNDIKYDKIQEFVESLFNVFKMINKKADTQKDKRMKLISLTIYNYVIKNATDYKIDLKKIKDTESINLIPIFEYINYNNIELYDFSKINVTDVDVTQSTDLERFVLTHIYYLTQSFTK